MNKGTNTEKNTTELCGLWRVEEDTGGEVHWGYSEESLKCWDENFELNFLVNCGCPCSSVDKESACSAGDPGSSPGLGRSPEKERATNSSILAWKISCTEEPGGLQSMGLQRAGHN